MVWLTFWNSSIDGLVKEEVTPVFHVGLDAKPDIFLWEFWNDDFETITR